MADSSEGTSWAFIGDIVIAVLDRYGPIWLMVILVAVILAWRSPALVKEISMAWDRNRKTKAMLTQKQKSLENAAIKEKPLVPHTSRQIKPQAAKKGGAK